MKRILSFLILFMSLTASSFAVAETTFIEDLTYVVSRMPDIETGNGARVALRNYNKSGRTYFSSDEVDKATKLVSSFYIDCVKYNYINSKEERHRTKGGIKFIADLLRDDTHGDVFRGGESARVAVQGFLLSRYRGLSEKELNEKIKEDYGIKLKEFSSNILNKKAMDNEYCNNNKKILEEKIAEIAER